MQELEREWEAAAIFLCVASGQASLLKKWYGVRLLSHSQKRPPRPAPRGPYISQGFPEPPFGTLYTLKLCVYGEQRQILPSAITL